MNTPLKLIWDHFTETDWTDYCAKAENQMLALDDLITSVRVGDLCFDIVVGEPETTIGENRDKTRLFIDLYVGGIDDGYGYSSYEAIASGRYQNKYNVPDDELYPYTQILTESGSFPDGCVWMTYEQFKNEAEKKMLQMLEEADKTCDYGIMKKASQPLHIW